MEPSCCWSQAGIQPSAIKPYKEALVGDGIPVASFQVEGLDAEFYRLRGLGAVFTQAPADAGPVKVAVLNDTCGNLIQLIELKDEG
jgi:hypothetical protein